MFTRKKTGKKRWSSCKHTVSKNMKSRQYHFRVILKKKGRVDFFFGLSEMMARILSHILEQKNRAYLLKKVVGESSEGKGLKM